MKYAPLLLSAATLSACVQPQDTAPRVGTANPASEYCVSLGGRPEIRNEAAGQVGYCHLPDGSVVEEWALFRAQKR